MRGFRLATPMTQKKGSVPWAKAHRRNCLGHKIRQYRLQCIPDRNA